ncbi:hypothetical protein B0A65_06645 [Flavobacterium frigidimaris]|uniref:Uncharacterized protein n=1 Tax=Flavobacterium frigidimaris TaxID=262320 RepID=A0ABX4BSS2_FLAFR|nr:hypothetical protein B0A65_06645 [Flavobacterium frigidimaris]
MTIFKILLKKDNKKPFAATNGFFMLILDVPIFLLNIETHNFITLHLCIVNFKDLIKIGVFYYFK